MRAAVLFVPCLLLLVGSGAGTKATASNVAKPATNVTLHTLPELHPPVLHIDQAAKRTSPGYVFVGQKGGNDRPSGPVIADNRGRIVWYHEVPSGLEVTDFRAQTYRGRPVLTWWQGIISKAGIGRGSYVVYDALYKPLATVKAAHGLDGDLHEFQLTPRGTAYITVYHEVPADLRSVGGPKDGYAYDSIVQELDVETGKVVFEWHSIGHVALAESIQANREPAHHATKKRPLDYFHVNSIADGPGGTILISGRNTTRAVPAPPRRIDRLAPRRETERLRACRGGEVPVSAQRALPRRDDDLALRQRSDPERGAVHAPARAEARSREEDRAHRQDVRSPKKLSSPFEGSLELLPDGGAFVGWGGIRKVTEFTPGGKVRFQMTLPYGDTYRGYRLPWPGDPGGKPLVAVDGDRVYASWDGKRGIARWQVLAEPGPPGGDRVAAVGWPRDGDRARDPSEAVAVRALDAAGTHSGGRPFRRLKPYVTPGGNLTP